MAASGISFLYLPNAQRLTVTAWCLQYINNSQQGRFEQYFNLGNHTFRVIPRQASEVKSTRDEYRVQNTEKLLSSAAVEIVEEHNVIKACHFVSLIFLQGKCAFRSIADTCYFIWERKRHHRACNYKYWFAIDVMLLTTLAVKLTSRRSGLTSFLYSPLYL